MIPSKNEWMDALIARHGISPLAMSGGNKHDVTLGIMLHHILGCETGHQQVALVVQVNNLVKGILVQVHDTAAKVHTGVANHQVQTSQVCHCLFNILCSENSKYNSNLPIPALAKAIAIFDPRPPRPQTATVAVENRLCSSSPWREINASIHSFLEGINQPPPTKLTISKLSPSSITVTSY